MSTAEDLMAKLTGGQKGGGTIGKFMIDINDNRYIKPSTAEYTGKEYETEEDAVKEGGIMMPTTDLGGRRRKSHSGRKGHKSNSWLAHVKATMKLHPGKSFKQVLKIAKKTYKRSQSQSQSQSGGRKRKGSKRQSQKKYQNGGSGGKMAGLGESAAPYV